MALCTRPQEMKKQVEELLKAYRASSIAENVDDSATTMGKAFSRYSEGRACYLPIVWDTGCSKIIISEEAVKV